MAVASPVSVAPSAPNRAFWRQLRDSVGLAVVLGLMLLGGYHLVLHHLRHSLEGQLATKRVAASTQLQELLGLPMVPTLEAGEVSPDGNATFSFNVTGPKGEAGVDLKLVRKGAEWRFESGVVDTPDGMIPFEGR